jgi:hypothetical protein
MHRKNAGTEGKLKKYKYIEIGLLVLVLQGCGSPSKMDNFIPTPTPAPTSTKSFEKLSSDETATDGKVQIKYVNLSKYGASLNVRSEPSSDAKIIGKLMHMQKVEVIDIQNGWACYKEGDKLRYVNADYLVDDPPKALTPAQ